MENLITVDRKTTTYHPSENGVVESFNKTFHSRLTKNCNLDRDEWDNKILNIIWAYRTTYKQLA